LNMSELTTWPTKNKPLDKCGTVTESVSSTFLFF
jgi:hypothetical protein